MKCLSESTSTMCHTSASPCCHSANPRPICQSNANPLPNKFQSSPIYSQSVRASRRGHANCQPTHVNNPVTRRGTSLVWGPTAGLVDSVSILCQSWTNRQILHQFINSFQIRQLLHIIEALVKSSKTTTNQTTFPIGHRLATSAPIPDQSEDSSAHKRGTSILCGPTEVSQRRTISHAIGKSRASSRLSI